MRFRGPGPGFCLAVLAILLLGGCASTHKHKPTRSLATESVAEVLEENQVAVTATVETLNLKTHILGLRLADGTLVKVHCGPEIRNFSQIQAGDEVRAEFHNMAALFLADSEAEPDAVQVKRAGKSRKPGPKPIRGLEIRAVVEAMDAASRHLRLRKPDGHILNLDIGPEVGPLDSIRVGDRVVARYTEVSVITVQPPDNTKRRKPP